MKIDWFTVIAQIINFLVLVWLLKRFLYQPILDAVDKREQKITSQLTEAEAKKVEAQLERDEFQQKNAAFDTDRAAKMDEVRKEAEEEKHRLFEEVRQESKVLQSKYETSLKQETEQMTEMLKRKMQDEVFAIAQKTLGDLADVNLEERLVNVFIDKIQNLEGDDKKHFVKTFAEVSKVKINSAFELPDTSKSKLENVIQEITGKPIQVDYESGPELVSGIAIHTDRYSLSWNIDAYLESLKKDIVDFSAIQTER